MRPDHRHELKTNELAEWIANFPQWFKENLTVIVGTAAVIVVAVGLYFGLIYRKNVASARERLRLTGLITQLPFQKMQVAQAQAQGRDQSFILLPGAENLKSFAQSTKDDQMAALALIERAETLRAELQYRLGNVSRDDLIEQIGQAKASYTEAQRRASSNPSLAAKAKYGLGLCEEELDNFDNAEQIYREILKTPQFDATVARAAAEHRLKTMRDYKGAVLFREKPKSAAATKPQIQIGPTKANLAAAMGRPADANLAPPTGSAAGRDANQGVQKPKNTEAPKTRVPGR